MFGKRIRSLRKANNMTQEDLAKHFKCAKSTISQYENGINEPDIKTILRFADFFNVSVDYLLGRVEEAAKNYYNYFADPTILENLKVFLNKFEELPANHQDDFIKMVNIYITGLIKNDEK